LFAENSWPDSSDVFPRHIEGLDTIYARCNNTSILSFFLIAVRNFDRKFYFSSWSWERVRLAGVLFESFAMVGSQTREGNWISILSEFTCQAALALVGVNLVALSLVAILSWSKLWQEFWSVSLHWQDSSSRLEKVSKMQFSVAKFSRWCRRSLWLSLFIW
jgi:DNA-binding transcriptional LysR family regulator